MFERIFCMLIKEFILLFRDPRMRFIVFVPPILDLLMFGYAATTDVRNIRIAIYDLAQSVESREFVTRFAQSKHFELVEYVSDDRRVYDLLNRSHAQVVLCIQPDFGRTITAGRPTVVQILLDGADSNTAVIIGMYCLRIAQQYNHDIVLKHVARMQGAVAMPAGIELQTRVWFNENMESRYFIVPGIIAINLMVTALILTSMATVREREIGTLEQVLVSPIAPYEFIIGKAAPFALIGIINTGVLTVIGTWWFEVPFRGSVGLLMLAAFCALLTNLAAGLLVSTICRTQQQAMMSGMFILFPVFLLSGFFFPIANMPEVIQWLTYLNPLRYFLIILRGIFLKGAGLDVLWSQYIALASLGIVALFLAIRRFRKTIA